MLPPRQIAALLSALLIGGCVHSHMDQGQFPTVSVQELKKNPDAWDGKRVIVEGWLARDFENFNLYADRSSACAGEGRRTVVGAQSAQLLAYGTMRRGLFEGTFRYIYGNVRGDEIIVSTGSASPGPLEDIRVIRWKSAAEAACR